MRPATSGSAERLARFTLSALALAPFLTGLAGAVCLDIGGFAIFQCADLAYFAPPPVPVAFDAAGRPTNMSVVFWQIGFGNQDLNTGKGTTGTGNSSLTTFNGNDQGIFGVDIKDARLATGQPSIPAGATCVSNANWANFGVDGCSDNPRAAALAYADDGILNGYFNFYDQYNSAPGYFSLNWQQDYPMAVLLKAPAQVHACDTTTAACDLLDRVCTAGPRAGLPCAAEIDCDFCSDGPKVDNKCSVDHQCADDGAARYVAFAAVATVNRGNNGGNGPCAGVPGSNPAPCDLRPGFYNLRDIANGTANMVVGSSNVVPWQPVPSPSVVASTPDPNGSGTILLDLSWTGLTVHSDQSARPSTNPGMGGSGCASPGCCAAESCTGVSDPTRAPGVGVLDVASKFGGLVRYKVEVAAESDTGFAAPLFSQETFGTTMTGVPVSSTDGCFRLRTLFGKRPETSSAAEADCRLGKCGDIGYEVRSGRICAGGCLPTGPEICDDLDNDCNGFVDDGNLADVGQACAVSGRQGVCAQGRTSCEPGGQLGCIQLTFPTAEVCDNFDNDCDGSIDGMATWCGFGPCAATGNCVAGIDTCRPGTPAVEICNGVDDDCDGTVDDVTSTPTTCGTIGACASTGHTTCTGGVVGDSCVPGTPTAEKCNNIDDDCDGFVDEGNPGGGPSCNTGRPGVCSAGTTTCQSGSLRCIQNTPATSFDVCGDGLDNDCDGLTDAQDPDCQPLLVELASFEAKAGHRGITITWSTATEIDNAGFMLLRGESVSGPFTPLMPSLIPGKGSAVSGAAYTYEDRAVLRKKVFYYVLVDVDLNGVETRHGPAFASIGAPKPDRRGRDRGK